MSRVGKLPVAIPAGVKVTVNSGMMTVEGPKGKLSQEYDSSLIDVKVEEKSGIRVCPTLYDILDQIQKEYAK